MLCRVIWHLLHHKKVLGKTYLRNRRCLQSQHIGKFFSWRNGWCRVLVLFIPSRCDQDKALSIKRDSLHKIRWRPSRWRLHQLWNRNLSQRRLPWFLEGVLRMRNVCDDRKRIHVFSVRESLELLYSQGLKGLELQLSQILRGLRSSTLAKGDHLLSEQIIA